MRRKEGFLLRDLPPTNRDILSLSLEEAELIEGVVPYIPMLYCIFRYGRAIRPVRMRTYRWPEGLPHPHRLEDEMERRFHITKWKKQTLLFVDPRNEMRLIRHPADVTRGQRKGHKSFYWGPSRLMRQPPVENGLGHDIYRILDYLDELPRNAPCPHIVRVEWLTPAELTEGYEMNLKLFSLHLTRGVQDLEKKVALTASSWRLQWWSWDVPRQSLRSPAMLLCFGHRPNADLTYRIHRGLMQRMSRGRNWDL